MKTSMRTFLSLLRINIYIAFLQLNFVRRGKRRSRNNFIVMVVVVVALVVGYLSYYAWTLSGFLQPYGFTWLLLPFMLVLIMAMIFMTSLYTVNSILFESRDAEQLMAYPISLSTIIYSKLVALVIESWVVGLVFAVPISAVYVIRTAPAWWFYPNMLLATLFAVLMPLALILLIALISAAVSSGRRFRQALQLVITLALVAGIGFFVRYMIGFAQVTGIDNTALINALKAAWPPAGWITGAMVNGSGSDFLVALAIGVVPFVALVGLTTLSYRRILSAANTAVKYKSGPLKLSTRPPWQTLLGKEFRRYRSSLMYVLNSSIGLVIGMVFIILSLVNKGTLHTVFSLTSADPLPVYLLMLCVFTSMTCTTAPSISLEGKNLWIIKSLPVSALQVLGAKMALNMAISIPLLLVNAVLATIAVNGGVLGFVLLFVPSALLAVLTGMTGLIANLRYHRFDFYNDMQVVKNSASVMITFLSMWVLIAAAAGLFYLLHGFVSFNLYIVGVAIVLAALCIGAYLYLNRNAERLYQALDSGN